MGLCFLSAIRTVASRNIFEARREIHIMKGILRRADLGTCFLEEMVRIPGRKLIATGGQDFWHETMYAERFIG